MPSGKQSKRRRRVDAPTPPSTRRRAPAQRTRRTHVPPPPTGSPGTRLAARRASPRVLLAVVASVVVVGGVAAGLAITLSGGSSPGAPIPAVGSLRNALPGAAEVARLFRRIPQHGNVLGRRDARATMVEYIDLQCPYCQQFETQVIPSLIGRYVRNGKLRVVARPIAFIGPDSARGRAAAIAAGHQNRMFNLMELLYVNQGTENTGWLSDGMVQAAAASIPGLDVKQVITDAKTSAVQAAAHRYDVESDTDRVTETPTFFVGSTGHNLTMLSRADEASLAAAIAKAAARAR